MHNTYNIEALERAGNVRGSKVQGGGQLTGRRIRRRSRGFISISYESEMKEHACLQYLGEVGDAPDGWAGEVGESGYRS